jgi:photosynthetic reaction center H subunit
MINPLIASQDLNELAVYDADGVPIGQTFGVLTDAETGLVRYFDIALDERRRHVLVPVGHARIEKHLGRMRVRLRAAGAQDLDEIPAYEPHVPWTDDDVQNELLNAYGRLFNGERYYAHPAYDHTGLYAGQHPILKEPLAAAAPAGLRRLSTLPQYRIADGEPEITGWPVQGDEDARIGTVTDVIVDTDAEQVRYLVLRRDSDGTEVAVPVGYATLHKQEIGLPFSAADLDMLPPAPAELTRADEAALRVDLDRALTGPRRYARPDFRPPA